MVGFPLDTVCWCSPGSPCTRFTSETYGGHAGKQAQQYKARLWWATTGHLLGEEALSVLKREVAAVLGMGNDWPFPTTGLPPRFGYCATVWTVKVLRYRLCQGSPHTAAALMLIPSFPPGHFDFPVLGCLAGVVGQVYRGTIPNYMTHPPDVATVWPNGVLPPGYKTDMRFMEARVSEIWRTWAKLRAGEMLGKILVWDDWSYEEVAPRPSPPHQTKSAFNANAASPWQYQSQYTPPVYMYDNPYSTFSQVISMDIDIPRPTPNLTAPNSPYGGCFTKIHNDREYPAPVTPLELLEEAPENLDESLAWASEDEHEVPRPRRSSTVSLDGSRSRPLLLASSDDESMKHISARRVVSMPEAHGRSIPSLVCTPATRTQSPELHEVIPASTQSLSTYLSDYLSPHWTYCRS